MSESVLPVSRKTAPASTTAASANAETYYGERNTGIRLVSTGKIDEEAEAARKALIRSMGKKPQNSVTDRWAAPKVKTQNEVIEETGDRRISSSHKKYEERRNSRIEQRREELEKLAGQKEAEEKDRRDRIEKRRMERLSSSGSGSSIADRINRLSVGDSADAKSTRKVLHFFTLKILRFCNFKSQHLTAFPHTAPRPQQLK